jgi:asparagine synthase (glutamine-hydrolysing)
MSGYFGIVRTDGAAVEEDFLKEIAHGLQFRGPDGRHIHAKDGVGFSFALRDLGTFRQVRRQPVQLGGRFWLIGEVRLDARGELLAELQQKGQQVGAESSDEELVLSAWNVWGEPCLSRLLGDFSFGLWDAEERSLCCARDFTGTKPLFYARTPGAFCFTNTLQALQCVPEISRELDDLFVLDFLVEGMSRDPERTVWRDIRRLTAGHLLRLSSSALDPARFQQLPVEDPLLFKHRNEYLEGFRERLQIAVADRLPQGKCALYLSRGLDSASVSAMAVKVASLEGTSQNLKAFTVSWRALMDDPEPEFAKFTARHLGLSHDILQPDAMPYEGAETATPEPTAEVFFGYACQILRAVAAHSCVVLSGDGGDNVLEGEAWPYFQYLRGRGEWTGITRTFSGYVLAHGRIPPMRAGVRSWFRRRFHPQKAIDGVPAWLNGEFSNRVRVQLEDRKTRKESLPVHPVHPAAYRSLHSGYWPAVLEEEDATWTGILLETRAPFLDLRLLRFLLRLPPVPWCMNKELTRRGMKGFLPVEILKRRKTPLPQDVLTAYQAKAKWCPKIPQNPQKLLLNL